MVSIRLHRVSARSGGRAHASQRSADSGTQCVGFRRHRWRRTGGCLALALLLHLGAVVLLTLSWTPVPHPSSPPGIMTAKLVSRPAPPPVADLRVADDELQAERAAADPLARQQRLVNRQTTAARAVPMPSAQGGIPGAVRLPPAAEAPEEARHVDTLPGTAGAEAAPTWDQRVLAHLDRHKRYPALAERRGDEDAVILQLRVDRDGNVLSQEIVASRGYRLLDAEAMELVRRAAPLPPPPPDVPDPDLEFRVPVEFHIESQVTRLW